MTLDWQKIQEKWQKAWAKAELGRAKAQKNKEKFFMIFAYPGISGYLHVGHMRGFSYTDAICRYERLLGKEVLFPVGTHASGNQAIAFAKKVESKDENWLAYLRKNGCPEKTISKLSNPKEVIAFFNDVYVNHYWKRFGFLCDWERFTCTTFPDYEKFIHWQFRKLQQKNLLVQKPYFATACIVHGPVAVDPSETDISKGGTAEKQEYTLLKFSLGNDLLVAATLRPETIFGQTNLWINPEAQYVRV
ncbi:class I tRNA ligase family protein, partial [Candidatus Woesearchaeota archaeon]|nr:class I tRNA ligase family protein [Candidatus Woesearchaeota archaeon]